MDKEKETTIAYEIAMLVQENRELRDKIKSLESQIVDYEFDYERVIQKLKRKEEQENEENAPVFLPADTTLKKGDFAVITGINSRTSKYCIGFVIKVDHISVRSNGFATLFGTCFERNDISGAPQKFVELRINNRYYSWERAKVNDASTIVIAYGACADFLSTIAYDQDRKRVYAHYECDDLAPLD